MNTDVLIISCLMIIYKYFCENHVCKKVHIESIGHTNMSALYPGEVWCDESRYRQKFIISQETASRKDIKWVVEERSNLERESKVTED